MAVYDVGTRPIVESEGTLTDPASGTVAADSGALMFGVYEVRVYAGASVAAAWILNRRNAANGADVGDQPRFYSAATDGVEATVRVGVEQGERIRLTSAGYTGTGVGALQLERLT